MKRYPKYKDSGVEWIGEVPEGWNIKGLKYLLKPSNDGIKIGPFGSALKSSLLSISGYKVYGQENVIHNDFELGFRYIGQDKFDELSIYEICPGDLLITMMGTTGQAQLVPENIEQGIMDSHLIRVRPEPNLIAPNFLQILINNSAYIFHQKKLQSKGSIMEGLNSSIIKSFFILLPSLHEQTAIANYLDRKTAEIDRLISNKERLIELYEEEKTAVINQAVTKGLDPDAPMKPSGIDWLGDVPEHWGTEKIKWVTHNVITGKTPPSSEESYYNGDVEWFGPGDFNNDLILSDSKRKISQDAINKAGIVVCPKHSVFLVGIGATLGKVCITINPAASNQQINAIIFKDKKVNPFYGLFFLHSYKDAIVSLSNSATLPIFNQTQTKEFELIVPPLNEQNAIIKHIETECNRLNAIIDKFKKQIELLKEYRTTLISEVVTGKIDVRDEVTV